MSQLRSLLVLAICFQVLCTPTLCGQTGPVQFGEACDGSDPDKSMVKALKSFQRQDYPTAQVQTGAALRSNEADVHGLYLKGHIALRMRQVFQAQMAWQKLVEECPSYDPNVLFFLGTIELEMGQQDRAKDYLARWLARDDRDYAYDEEAEQMLAELTLKEQLYAHPVPFNPQPLTAINTQFDEYLGALTPDGSAIYFTRRSKKRDRFQGPANVMRTVEEFSRAGRTGRQGNAMPTFDEGEPLPAPFNTQYNEGGPSITADNRYMVFTVCVREANSAQQNCDLYSTSFEYGSWGPIRPLPSTVNDPASWESQPSLSPNGDVLYFTSDRASGYGGLDLYRSVRLPDGSWGPAQNLGPNINTPKNEKSPFIHMDSESLYFASDGHIGLGGYDLFKANALLDAPFWTRPVNLGYPINSEEDEIGLSVTLDGKQAYFASNKINTAQGWDIYYFDLHESIKPKEVVFVKGKVQVHDKASSRTDVVLRDAESGKEVHLQVSEEDQTFSAVVQTQKAATTVIRIENEQAAFSATPVLVPSKSVDPNVQGETVAAEVVLEQRSLASGELYPIPHILFETASDQLTGESELLIQEFARYLLAHPNLRVQLQGHTDNVGDAQANLELSRRRAMAVANLLVHSGVSQGQVSHVGYGETRPIATNATPEGRAKNRRTVFLVEQL